MSAVMDEPVLDRRTGRTELDEQEPVFDLDEGVPKFERGPREINMSGDVVHFRTEEYPEKHRELVRWIFAHAKDLHWSWNDLEHHTGLNKSTYWRIWTGTYRYQQFIKKGGAKVANPNAGKLIPLDSVCTKLAHFKSLAEDRASASKQPFVETSVFSRLNDFCRDVLVTQSIGMIYGESQIGKTWALREIARRNRTHTSYVLMPASAGVQGMIRAIGQSTYISATLSASVDTIRTRIFDYFDSTKQLIIDEVHECFESHSSTSLKRCLSVLRQLQEHTGCGLVLCGTNVWRNELEFGSFAKSLLQLRKRGIWELQLEAVPEKDDLDLIAAHYRLGPPTGDAATLVKSIAEEMGLGKYTRFLARAGQLAAKKGERLAWRHFENIVGRAVGLKKR
jgi:DNA transposition AAA+ family ATPase